MKTNAVRGRIYRIGSRIGRFLSKRWWAGIGVIGAIALGILALTLTNGPNTDPRNESTTSAVYETPPTHKQRDERDNPAGPQADDAPISELEQELEYITDLRDDPNNHLVVHADQTLVVNRDHYQSLRSVTLNDNSTLIVRTDTSDWTLHTLRMEVGQGVQIKGRGEDGGDGPAGEPGSHAQGDCENGTNGTDGRRGEDGTNGVSITIKTVSLIVAGQLKVDTSGGSGGDGGAGGSGGNGGKADRSEMCRGGSGGPGGRGGDAGKAGNGGNLSIRYVRAYSDDKETLDVDQVKDLIRHDRDPGGPGLPGSSGPGGSGGPGREGEFFGLGSQPGGHAGNDGSPGLEGGPGRTASTEIAPG